MLIGNPTSRLDLMDWISKFGHPLSVKLAKQISICWYGVNWHKKKWSLASHTERRDHYLQIYLNEKILFIIKMPLLQFFK